ncbi:hypothetical protein L1987_08608 [Smallanthus sonchifolius]|uniref:Uncharacterized protein n=1 Tax=Smallanthus sonchifolius TaxID=185202 RepID=A0ACB9JP23_9ASTR|nr:hypothetical protein L1987_08608 [Smallanthus sonchifolius]
MVTTTVTVKKHHEQVHITATVVFPISPPLFTVPKELTAANTLPFTFSGCATSPPPAVVPIPPTLKPVDHHLPLLRSPSLRV